RSKHVWLLSSVRLPGESAEFGMGANHTGVPGNVLVLGNSQERCEVVSPWLPTGASVFRLALPVDRGVGDRWVRIKSRCRPKRPIRRLLRTFSIGPLRQ